MAELVDMCRDCTSLCTSKTRRVLENRSRSPRGWEKEYDEVAMSFQKHEFEQCLEACARVQRQCPEPTTIRQRLGVQPDSVRLSQSSDSRPWWKFWSSGSQVTHLEVQQSTVVTDAELGVCENAAGDFSNVLFMLAHKPTKVQFHSYDPKTGDAYNPDTGEWITRNKANQSSKEITAMLVDKWNSGLHGKHAQRAPEVNESDAGMPSQQSTSAPAHDPSVRGTVPRF